SCRNSTQNKTTLVWDVHICLARTTVPVNATQCGPAVNRPSAPAVNSSLFNFLTTGPSNSAVADFKTIAASFFAAPTTTTATAPANTNLPTANPAARFSRRREIKKTKGNKFSELLPVFFPAVPMYLLPTLTPQASKEATNIEVKATETKTDSTSAST